MVTGIPSADWLWILCGLAGYGVLFARTIRQNRKDRSIVLGVVTVSMFGGFLFLVYLTQRHAAAWLVSSVLAVTILTGVCVLLLVSLDVAQWMRRKGSSELNEKHDKPATSGMK